MRRSFFAITKTVNKKRLLVSLLAAIILDGIANIILLGIFWPLVFVLAIAGLLAAIVTWALLAQKFIRDHRPFLTLFLMPGDTTLQFLSQFLAGICFLLPGPFTAILGVLLLVPSCRRRLFSRSPGAEPQDYEAEPTEDHIPASQMTIDVKPLKVRDAE